MDKKCGNEDIIKSFQFESENVILILYIRKSVYKSILKMFIDADVIVNNIDIVKHSSESGTSVYTGLSYRDSQFFWLGTNDWKGMRWGTFKNETGIDYYTNLQEMKEKYIRQREYISLISEYFFESIKKYKKAKMLFETQIDDIL